MAMSKRILGLVVSGLMLVSCGQADDDASVEPSTDGHVEPSTDADAEFNVFGFLGGTANPTFAEGEQGEVSIVSQFPAVGHGYFHVVLRNNTDDPITRVRLTGTVLSDGELIRSGRSEDTMPAVIQPGEAGIVFVHFDESDSLPEDAEYAFESEWEKEGDTQFYQRKDLQVTELNVVDDSLVGSAANTTDSELESPFAVHVVCFVGDDIVESRRILADQDGTIMPGETVTFSDERYTDTCTEHLVSVSGYFG